MVQHGLGDRGEACEVERRSSLVHVRDGLGRLEVLHGQQRSAGVDTGDQRQHEAHVEHGQRIPHAVVGSRKKRVRPASTAGRTRASCEIGQPLGMAVVPEVYIIIACHASASLALLDFDDAVGVARD